ncbi:hypothetical protein K438DRAFT_1984596 [Mycena galopus ATCC 62051]|nr:hypothetical protein K438DRAFT_1984596 [Mycena galopus ATCC 62051]
MLLNVADGTHSVAADVDLLDSLPGRTIFTHQLIFGTILTFFLTANGSTRPSKLEALPLADFSVPSPAIKTEYPGPDITTLPDPIRTHLLRENGQDVFEILSDSEPTNDAIDSDVEVSEVLLRPSSRSSSITPIGIELSNEMYPDPDNEGFHIETDPSDEMYPDPEEFHAEGGLQQSDTIWQDPGITSLVLVGKFRISTKVTVQRVEFVMPHDVIPSIWPNPRIPTAFVLNLGSSYDEIDPKTGKMYTVDFLIKNHDNDSWKSDGSGTGSDKPNIRFDPGQPTIECRRPRMGCKGCYACERIDRYELDPASRDAIFSAQQETRQREGTTAEDVTAGFFDIVDKRCPAVDSAGKPCQGRPKLMSKKEINRGHNFWVACDGWRKDFKENHRTYSISDYVNEKMLIKLFAGEPIADGTLKDTPPCTMIVPSRTGLKQKNCPHTHIVDGHVVTRSATKRYLCQVKRTTYVPEDPSIRKALLVHTPHVPHRHPMPALGKISLDLKDKYETCVETVGCVGATHH